MSTVKQPTMNIGIEETKRKEIANHLARLLADTYTLYLKTHQFHWNVTGPQFDTLHKMFETHYNELWTAVDVVAERIRTLGEKAPGTYSEFSSLTSIKEESGHLEANEMIQSLVDGHEAVIRTARSFFSLAQDAKDEVTVSLLTDRLDVHEKTAWMLRSMLA